MIALFIFTLPMLKFLFFPVLTLCAITATQVPANSTPKWVPVSKSIDGDVNYIDINYLRRQGNTVRYWGLMQFSQPNAEGVASIQSSVSGDCRSMKYRVRSERQFSFLEEEIGYFNDGDSAPVSQAKPRTMIYSALALACKAGTWKNQENSK